MASSRSFLTFTRCTVLALMTTSAFAAGPWFRGGGGHRGGLRGGPRGGGWSTGVGFYGGVGMVTVLPHGYATFRYRGDPWYFGGGHWYRPWRSGYAAFYPPVGLCLSVLPLGYATYVYGGVPYYYYEDVYYTSIATGGFQVVEPPPGRDEGRFSSSAGRPEADRPDPALDALLIIPKEGQNEARMLADRQKAQRYAREESRYDPAASDASDPGTPRARRAYLRALKAYLEERGYSVK